MRMHAHGVFDVLCTDQPRTRRALHFIPARSGQKLAVSRSSRSPSTQRRPSAALRLEHLLLTAHQRVRAKLPKGSQHDSRRRMKRACRAHAIGGGHRPDCGIHPVTSWRISKPGGVSFPRGALRKVRPVLHHWFGAERVPINGADHHPYAGSAGPVPDRQLRGCA